MVSTDIVQMILHLQLQRNEVLEIWIIKEQGQDLSFLLTENGLSGFR